jgi:ACR3 family arsenite efflux pump ArsB
MDQMLVALIAAVWNYLAAGQNTILLGIVLATFANIVVLYNMARLLFVQHEYAMNLI